MKRIAILIFALILPAAASARDSFNVCWSIYVGWIPWAYGAEQDIVKKWGDRYGIDINVVQINDYIESVNQYTAGEIIDLLVVNTETPAGVYGDSANIKLRFDPTYMQMAADGKLDCCDGAGKAP